MAQAELIGRYQCNVIGTAVPEPLGDRNGHSIVNFGYSCVGVEGILKDAVVTAFSASETVNFINKSTGPNRFEIVFTD